MVVTIPGDRALNGFLEDRRPQGGLMEGQHLQ